MQATTLHEAMCAELDDLRERCAAAHGRIDELLEAGHAVHLDVRRRLARLVEAERLRELEQMYARAHDPLGALWLIFAAILGAALLLFTAFGCADGRSNHSRFDNVVVGGASTHAQLGGSIVIGTIEVLPPPFMRTSDYADLARALGEYENDVTAALGWTPRPGLVMIFQDRTGPYAGPRPMRSHILDWPYGTHGRPEAIAFAPLWSTYVVVDRRETLGIPLGVPLTTPEFNAIVRGRSLPVALRPQNPAEWDW